MVRSGTLTVKNINGNAAGVKSTKRTGSGQGGYKIEFQITRFSTRQNALGLGLGIGLGLHFIELIYWLIQYCKSAGKFCHKKFRE